MEVNLNKIEKISTVDYPGKSACVVFFNGCPWRCGYCHNKQTWTDVNMVDVEYVKEQIKLCLPFVSAVVFSGGEPTMQIESLIELCKYSKELGLFVGVETNGYNPFNMLEIKQFVDTFFVDIKAPIDQLSKYKKITGSISSAAQVDFTLHHKLPIEIRIVDTNKFNTKDIIKSIKTNHKITILPYINRNKGSE